jgi:GNAT superfamily N-acetyltransferase
MIVISDAIQLKLISVRDHSKLLELVKQIYPPAYKHMWKNDDCGFYFEKFYSLDNLNKELAEAESEYYFIYYKTHLDGILRMHFNKALKTKPETSACYLHRIYLSEDAQGKGIGQKLLSWVEQRAKSKGDELLWLEAMDTQQQALRFYKKQGFTESHKAYLDFEPLRDRFRGMDVLFKVLN